MQLRFSLDPEELKLMERVYKHRTSDDMMIKCFRGATQNPNESLHSRIWRMCPKHKNTRRRHLDSVTD